MDRTEFERLLVEAKKNHDVNRKGYKTSVEKMWQVYLYVRDHPGCTVHGVINLGLFACATAPQVLKILEHPGLIYSEGTRRKSYYAYPEGEKLTVKCRKCGADIAEGRFKVEVKHINPLLRNVFTGAGGRPANTMAGIVCYCNQCQGE